MDGPDSMTQGWQKEQFCGLESGQPGVAVDPLGHVDDHGIGCDDAGIDRGLHRRPDERAGTARKTMPVPSNTSRTSLVARREGSRAMPGESAHWCAGD
ncbi:MAG: hypothetical protein R2844_06285 [Caldilineales bacterium]